MAAGRLARDGTDHFSLSYGDVAEEACIQCDGSPGIQKCGKVARYVDRHWGVAVPPGTHHYKFTIFTGY